MTMLMLLSILPGCGSSAVDERDAGADLTVTAEGQPCRTINDCGGPAFVCAYPKQDGCAAVGHCAPVATPTCAHVHYACGCHGEQVQDSDCFFEPGTAAAPVSGDSSCSDGGI